MSSLLEKTRKYISEYSYKNYYLYEFKISFAKNTLL